MTFERASKLVLGLADRSYAMNCLNSDCSVSREVRQEIEDTLLLPMAEIDKCRVT